MSNKVLFVIIGIAVALGVVGTLMTLLTPAPVAEAPTQDEAATTTQAVFCTADALLCPDGTFVGRTGPNCEFVCPELPPVPADVEVHINSKADRIVVDTPLPMSVIQSPLALSGMAVGPWYFEASAPVTLVNWDGLIIAEGYLTADGDWMTTEFVPFSGSLEFTSPYNENDPDFMKRGTLIFKKDNPSGLPEHDDALEIPVFFSL